MKLPLESFEKTIELHTCADNDFFFFFYDNLSSFSLKSYNENLLIGWIYLPENLIRFSIHVMRVISRDTICYSFFFWFVICYTKNDVSRLEEKKNK